MKRRFLSVLLCLTMLIGIFPMSVAAEKSDLPETEPPAEAVQTAKDDISLFAGDNVAEVTIGSTVTYYTDIDAAFAAAQEAAKATVKLLTDVTVNHTDDTYGIQLEKGDITLDLNGKTISQRSGIAKNKFYALSSVFYLTLPEPNPEDYSATLNSTTRLTVQDSTDDKNGRIMQPNGGPAVTVCFNTTLTVNSGTIENTASEDYDDDQFHMNPNCAVLLTDGGDVVIEGGTLSGIRGVAVTGYISKEEEGLVGIEGYNNDTYGNELTVRGGNISGTDGNALIVYEKAKKIELSGGTFTTQSNEYSIWVADTEAKGEPIIKGDAASLPASGYRFEYNGAECAYSENGNGVKGNATVKPRPANEYEYIGADGKVKMQADCTEFTAETDDIGVDGWYVLKENVTMPFLNISGNVNLILCDGATLTVGTYMNVAPGATLNLYWQSAGSGKLTAKEVSAESTVTAPAGEMKKTAGEGGTTFEKCLTHKLNYTDNNNGTHTATCELCGAVEGLVNHSFGDWTSDGADTHSHKCLLCGGIETANHYFSVVANDDGLTHGSECVCGYKVGQENHIFDETTGICSVCDAIKTATYNGKDYASLASAISAAKDGGTVTPAADVVWENVTITDGTTVTVDLNGKEWCGILTAEELHPVPLTINGGRITLKNGKLMQAGGGTSSNCGIIMTGGSLIVGDGMGIYASNLDDDNCYPAIDMQGGDLTLSVGTILSYGMKVADGHTLADYLPAGTAFTVDGSVINGYVQEKTGKFDLVVAQHTHSVGDDGACVCGFTCDHHEGIGDDGKCGTCGKQVYCAVVTVGGTPTNFENIYDALEAVKDCTAADGAAVKLLCDISPDRYTSCPDGFSEAVLVIESGTFTLDLSGHKISLVNEEIGQFYLLCMTGGDVTLKNGTVISDGVEHYPESTIFVEDSKLTLDNMTVVSEGTSIPLSVEKGADVTISDSKILYNGDSIYNTVDGVFLCGGKLNVKGNSEIIGGRAGILAVYYGSEYSTELTVSGGVFKSRALDTFGYFHRGLCARCNVKVTLTGGTFYGIETPDDTEIDSTGTTIVVEEGKPISTVIAEGYALYDEDNNLVDASVKVLPRDKAVHVDRHSSHTFDENGKCGCGYEVEASVTSNGTETYYKTYGEAFSAAGDGDTVTLFADITLGSGIDVYNEITLDLNGKTIDGRSLWGSSLKIYDAAVTVKNGTIKGSVGAIYVEGGDATLIGINATVTSLASIAAPAVIVDRMGSVTVESGTYQGLLVYSNSYSFATLNGGTFKPYDGGFSICRSPESGDEGGNYSLDCMELLGDGRTYFKNGIPSRTYGGFTEEVTVGEGTSPSVAIAQIGEVTYASLERALAAAKDGETVKLRYDVNLGNGMIYVDNSSNFTFDLDGRTITTTGEFNLYATVESGEFTVQNGTINGGSAFLISGEVTTLNVTINSFVDIWGKVRFIGGSYTGGVMIND